MKLRKCTECTAQPHFVKCSAPRWYTYKYKNLNRTNDTADSYGTKKNERFWCSDKMNGKKEKNTLLSARLCECMLFVCFLCAICYVHELMLPQQPTVRWIFLLFSCMFDCIDTRHAIISRKRRKSHLQWTAPHDEPVSCERDAIVLCILESAMVNATRIV